MTFSFAIVGGIAVTTLRFINNVERKNEEILSLNVKILLNLHLVTDLAQAETARNSDLIKPILHALGIKLFRNCYNILLKCFTKHFLLFTKSVNN